MVVPDDTSSTVAKVGDQNTAPRTTAEQDLSTLGQRRINLIWERVQAVIALLVVGFTVLVASWMCTLVRESSASEKQIAASLMAFALMSNLTTLVIGFYFGRTNHQRTGGVRSQETR